MQIGSFEIIHHTDTVRPEAFVVFTKKSGKLERAVQFGKRGGFRSMAEAVDAVTKTVRFGTVNV